MYNKSESGSCCRSLSVSFLSQASGATLSLVQGESQITKKLQPWPPMTTHSTKAHKSHEMDHVWIIMLMFYDNKHLASSYNIFYFFILLNFFGCRTLTNATHFNSRFSLRYTKSKWATVAEWWLMCMKHGPHSILQGQIIIAKDEREEFPEVPVTLWPEAFSAWLTSLLLLMLYTVYSLYIMAFTTAITSSQHHHAAPMHNVPHILHMY